MTGEQQKDKHEYFVPTRPSARAGVIFASTFDAMPAGFCAAIYISSDLLAGLKAGTDEGPKVAPGAQAKAAMHSGSGSSSSRSRHSAAAGALASGSGKLRSGGGSGGGGGGGGGLGCGRG